LPPFVQSNLCRIEKPKFKVLPCRKEQVYYPMDDNNTTTEKELTIHEKCYCKTA